MKFNYNPNTLYNAIVSNTKEVIPQDIESLKKEITILCDNANTYQKPINHYIGFEISGLIHLGTGISSALKIKDLTDAGVFCHIWLADFHTFLNKKLDGQLETIIKVKNEYFSPCMIECCRLVGCDMSKVKVLSAFDEYPIIAESSGHDFWQYDLDVCNNLTLSRVMKSISVTGKEAGDEVSFGTLRYAPMQVADAFFLQTHIVHAGIDQRKCHVLMRETANKLDPKHQLKIGDKVTIKPIAVHCNLLLGLGKPSGDNAEADKMSKSKPDTAIFVHDSDEEILRKFKKAYCPMPDSNLSNEENEKIQEANPILNWIDKLIFVSSLTTNSSQVITIEKDDYSDGNTLDNSQKVSKIIEYTSYQKLRFDYLNGLIHPKELKQGVAKYLIEWFAPIRKWADDKQELITFIQNIRKVKN